ncbi:MAG: 50S ribosomal protein L10 [Candidatus Cloacimonetes bacterium]|jgi:large subunit ribosomal protein L10|nr:50S ribosomal protein L10 [Candidatus Cloacimonadota bacterium]MDY0336353.1 50S ribosomal protein L10 [Candidatus Cloacimonadaceae bacterium]MCB5269367.1 50S ribosomal protein L10 [Candidatus Cloacimonadota bacterium]MCK9334996.1 50S ribosomal protein L10 [Candidatus Cloacimonadota bacterium]MDD2543204.1 50S ribosomal protein L10 [Candidatus Cloacimonadota bacterium]
MVQQYKVDIVKDLVERLSGAKAIVLVDYKGINIEQVNQLRARFRTDKVDYVVQKNTLLKIALNELNISGLDEYLKGPTAVAICLEDEVSPARVLAKFKKEVMEDLGFPTFKAGYVAGHVFNPKELEALASLPTREEILSSVVRCMAAPITGFMAVNQGIIRKFVYALNAIKDKQADAS